MFKQRRSSRPVFPLMFSLIVVLSLLLASCGGGNNNSEIPETGATAETEGVTQETQATQATEGGTPEGAATEQISEQPTGEPPTPEPEAAGTEVATQEAGTDGEAAEPITVGLELYAEGFTSPLVMVPSPDDSGRNFVADQIGVIYIVDEQGQRSEQPFLDIRDRMYELDPGYDERGLLGLAFHPDFANNNRFFIYYSAPLQEGAPDGFDHTSHVSEFTVMADNPDQADPDSEQILMQIDQPQMNHNGGQIAFGPDGYLYIPLGDGGAADDVGLGHVEDWYEANEGGNGQDLRQNLLGNILRIDVDNGDPYGIPEDNPYVGEEGIEEIYALGFRNPYRVSFDLAGDGALYAGDAGQALYEEVDIVELGGNYGWNVLEGTSCFNAADNKQPLDECPLTDPDGNPLIPPVIQFKNTSTFDDGLGNTVIGGNVYRGSAVTELEGMYVYGAWSTNFTDPRGILLYSPVGSPDELWPVGILEVSGREGEERLGEFLLSFGTDANNELYVLTTSMPGPSGETGTIYRIVPANGQAGN